MSAEVDATLAVLEILSTGDPSVADHVYAPDAVLWHNDGTGELDAREFSTGAPGLKAMIEGLTVEIVLAESLPGGAVVRYEIRGTVKSTGHALCARNCIFATVVDGMVTRVDEYLDPTFAAQLGL